MSRPRLAQIHEEIENRRHVTVLGLRLSDLNVAQAAEYMLRVRQSAEEGMGLFVTPNIQHIALARNDPEFTTAMQSAKILVADGFPVYHFARARGLPLPGRVTGREVIEAMFNRPEELAGHRCFFVVDSEKTALATEAWIAERFPELAVQTHVPSFGFEKNAEECTALGKAIRDFDTSLLFLCVGAPKSEVFAHQYRALLPPCWALCVGQSMRMLTGLTPPPPPLMVKLNLEWLWRLILEPRRMTQRYVPAMIGFLLSALSDLRSNRE